MTTPTYPTATEAREKCNVLCPKWAIMGHDDENGCIKPYAHNDDHLFIDQYGNQVKWEEDESCTCGCWSEDMDQEPCILYEINPNNHE